MIGGDMMADKTKEVMSELAQLIYKQTEDKKFTRDICLFMDTDAQMKKLIKFIKENNPTLNEINHRSFDIVMFDEN